MTANYILERNNVDCTKVGTTWGGVEGSNVNKNDSNRGGLMSEGRTNIANAHIGPGIGELIYDRSNLT